MARRSNGVWPARAGSMALALSLLVLSACGAPDNTARKNESQPPSTTAEPSSETLPSRAALDPLAPEQSFEPPERSFKPPERSFEPPAAPEQKTARAPLVPINDDPDQLMGLAPRAVSHLLGPPSLLRTETLAQVWQYTAADCVLDIYLYAEDETPDRSRVTYYEIRRNDFHGSSARACFTNIIAHHNLAAEDSPAS